MQRLLRWSAGAAAALTLLTGTTSQAQGLADSRAEFSGVQGQNDWFYGYRNYTVDGGGNNYDPANGFVAFAGGEGQGDWDGVSQFWDAASSQWDLNTEASGPWTFVASEGLHPNGDNSAPFEEHWAIRRWVANELAGDTVVQIVWSTRKQGSGGNGVTGGIWVNGNRVASEAIAGNNTTGITRTNYLLLKKADRVDLVLTPVGLDGGRADGNDGSFNAMTLSVPADTDSDGLPDDWERLYAGDLAKLNRGGDFDGDGLGDSAELTRGTDPTRADTDGDGLSDAVETNTGIFVSATNTGTDPTKADTDGDLRKDGDEVNGTPKTDVFDPDSDDDTYSDGLEVANGHDPNDPNDTLVSSLIANSAEEFSGVQGQADWTYGYRNVTADGAGQESYDPATQFLPFKGGEASGDWDGVEQMWSGSQWDLNTAAAAPWTELGRENVHPNGASPVHWVIRRWEAKKVTGVTPLALRYHVRKSNTGGGNGVTAGIFINGRRADTVTIAATDGTGVMRTYFANVAPNDKIDLILSPRGTDGGDADGSDGSLYYLHVDPRLPTMAYQPDGSVFIPAGAGDTDADGIPDVWEGSFFAGDLTKLSRTGDFDNDGLMDPDEYARDSDPTKPDTDGDGLPDRVETKTGTFVSATNTGSDPKKADTDGDGLGDSAEVNGTPATNPNRADSDGDGFDDPSELATGHDPNDPNSNVAKTALASSTADFSGVQGQKGWRYGYRDLTDLVDPPVDYHPTEDFLAFPGGQGEGDWVDGAQLWTGTAWDMNTAAAGPWTFLDREDSHPNGPNPLHWVIRRWTVGGVTAETPVALRYHVRKSNPGCGNGVTAAVHLNGRQLDLVTIPYNDGQGVTRTYYAFVKPAEVVDVVLRSTGTEVVEGSLDNDWCDGSYFSLVVDTLIPANAQQPDGTPFPPGSGITLATPVYSAGQLSLSWSSQAGATYGVEASTDLRSWTKIKTGHPSGGATTTYTDTPPAGTEARFYRVVRE